METVVLCLCLSLGAGARAPRAPDRLFGEDKFQHFFVSFLATSLAASAARAAGAERSTVLWTGAGAGAAAGVAKELLDARNAAHTASLLDLAWDAGGIALGTVIVAQAQE
jgi:uncharacterized protein YfiM (DUF2279 family)